MQLPNNVCMKRLFCLLALTAIFSFSTLTPPITPQERAFAADFLSKVEDTLLSSVKGLSEAQLKFKPAPDRWSVEECMKHIAMSEGGIWHMTDSAIGAPANAEKRADVKATDEQVIMMVSDRTHKQKAPEPFQPQNTPFKSFAEAQSTFKKEHEALIDFVKTTDKDLRNHVVALPFASFDAYQMVLFIGSHTKRHTKQILEVMADPNFPKK